MTWRITPILALFFAAHTLALGAESRSSQTAFSKPVEASVRADATPESDGLELQVNTAIFSKRERALLEMASSTTELLEDETLFYWNGIQLTGGHGEWKDGAYEYSIGVVPARMRLPIVRVPVGPIQIGVDAGVMAVADARARLMPVLGYPLEMMSLQGKISAQVTAAAFLEGYAKFLIVRGGVGGEITLVDGHAGVSGQVYAKGGFTHLDASGALRFLEGQFYAFVDYFNLIGMKWKRIIKPTLKGWKGFCVGFGQKGKSECEGTPSSSSPALD